MSRGINNNTEEQTKYFTIKGPHFVLYVVAHFMEWSPWNVCPVSQPFQIKVPVCIQNEQYQQLNSVKHCNAPS